MTKLFILGLLCGMVFPLVAEVQEGLRAYKAKDYQRALKEFQSAADDQNSIGIHLLASMYFQGVGTEQDVDKAVELFTQAAELGQVKSIANLGIMYKTGNGVDKNLTKAVDYFKRAAAKGDLQSSFNLGQMYRKGQGVEVDQKKMVTYLKYAAERGHMPAANEYGLIHVSGEGVVRNYIEAYAWFAIASHSGIEQADKNIVSVIELMGKEKVKEANVRANQVALMIKNNLSNKGRGF